MLKRALITLAGIMLAFGLLYGVVYLCLIRFSAGDVYPPLSSLRADPLGMKALHDAVREAGFNAERNYRPIQYLNAGQHEPFTLFYGGVSFETQIDLDEWSDLLQAAAQGNRVVLAFAPVSFTKTRCESARPPKPAASPKPATTPSSAPTPNPMASPRPSPTAVAANAPDAKASPAKTPRRRARKSDSEETRHREYGSFAEALERLGVKLQKEPAWDRVQLKARAADSSLEPVLSWHSAGWLDRKTAHQKVLYRCTRKPVIIECEVGRGSVVVSTDSFFISNEAMRDERAPRLLSRLVGGNRRVVFDESHHGVSEQTGIAGLMRAYHLESVFGVLALIAALYVWKNASPLLPRVRGEGEASRDDVVAGRNATEGFVNLLRRSIPHSRVVAACVEEWNRAFAHQTGPIGAPDGGESPEQQYLAAARIAAKKRRPNE